MASIFTEEFTLLGVGLAVILVRVISRIRAVGFGKLYWDDYLMSIAACIYIIETSLAWAVDALWQGKANNGLSDAARAAVVTGSEEYWLMVGGSKTQIAGQNSYTALLWTLKTSVCCFYFRLTKSLEGYRFRIKVGFAFIFISWFTVHITLLAGCSPFHRYWQIYPDPGNFCQAAISYIFIITSVVLDILTDAYLLSIPLPMLWMANIPKIRKAGLLTIFSGATFVMAAALIRCIIIMRDPIDGAPNSGYWACRETFVAVITSNLPVIWSSVRVLIRNLSSSPQALSQRSQKYSGDSNHTGSTEMNRLSVQPPRASTEGQQSQSA
ncbi:hypothetical protein BJ170DRAFT_659960 [Xylariales sp. AK1849]|nr:hypothetical protein BJ170DRAFT_659960 [Xylariales sp. AK1849]